MFNWRMPSFEPEDRVTTIDGKPVINRFAGEFAFLSNFHPSPFKYALDPPYGSLHIVNPPVEWATVEHAYQASKAFLPETREAIRLAASPAIAKGLGRKVKPLPSNWDLIKDGIMTNLVMTKFHSNKTLGDLLIATGDAVLIEGNSWGDKYWGQVNGKGENKLGKILMEVRAWLRDLRQVHLAHIEVSK